jgi:hypothetical protein
MRVRDFMRLVRGFVGVRAEGAVAQTLFLIFKLKKKYFVGVRCGWEEGGDLGWCGVAWCHVTPIERGR